MPIDPLYSDSTSTFLSGQNQANVPDPTVPAPSTSIGSVARAAGRGAEQGGASLFGAAADVTAGIGESATAAELQQGATVNPDLLKAADGAVNDAVSKLSAGHLFESPLGSRAYDLADTLKPDPSHTTAIDQTVQGAVSALTQIVPAAVAGGPVAGAAVGGASLGLSQAEDLKRQGVDVGTRTELGALAGGLGAVGAVMPVGGSTLARTAALVAVGGPGFSIGQGLAEKAILRNANYDHLADQVNPLDPTNLAASTIIAGVFGGAHLIGARNAAAGETGAPVAPVPAAGALDSMSVDQRKALPYNSPQLDAYATQAAQTAGVPPELLLFTKNEGERSNSNQVSPTGAKGVMQFEPDTFKAYGKGDIQDPINSINAGANYFADLLKRYDGDARAAVTEYNGGVKQAQLVHAGGQPTDPETIDYLNRFDKFAANHQITNGVFNPTPVQTDAALMSTGQRMVDDAHIGPVDDPASMALHQSMFETAARQMETGGMPDVFRGITDGDQVYASSLDGMISDAEDFRAQTAARASNLLDPGDVTRARQELDAIRAAPLNDIAADANIKDLTRQVQATGTKYKAAAKAAQAQLDALNAEQQARVEERQGHIDRLNRIITQNADAQQAGQQLPVLDTHIESLRARRAEVDIPQTRRTPIADFVSQISRAQRESSREPVGFPFRAAAADADAVRFRSTSEAQGGTGARGSAVRDDGAGGVDVNPSLDDVNAALFDASAADATEPELPQATKPQSAVEQNVRQAALDQPDTVAHLDSNEGEITGKLGDLVQKIDDEHQATLDDTKLFSVAANCFISLGG